jgi:hypothetical protein
MAQDDTMRNQRIRSFSFGNPSSIVDQWAVDDSNDSTDFESNDAWGNGAAIVEDTNIGSAVYIYAWECFLNQAERRFIKRQVGAIVRWNSQGSYDVSWYDSRKEMLKDWKVVQSEFNASYEDTSDCEYDEMYA